MAPNEIRKIHLPEERVSGKRLGRHVEHDPRSRDFPAHLATQIVSVNHQATGLPLDQGQIGSCFPPGTRIRMGDGSERPIEDVRLGERVVTAEGGTGRVISTMLRDEGSGLIRLVLWGHSHLRMTREHPVLTARGYVPAAELRIGDEVALPHFTAETNQAITTAEHVTIQSHRLGRGNRWSGLPGRKGLRIDANPLPEKIEPTPGAGRLLGLFLAEGACDSGKARWCYGAHEADTLVTETVRLLRDELAMYDIAQAFGRRPTIDWRESPRNRYAGRRLPRWTLNMADGGAMYKSRQDETHVWRKVRELRLEDYVGPVYNLSVEGDESYVAEGVGVHNCTANALCGALNSAPDYTGGSALTEKDAVSLYELETKLEGEPYPPNDPGGSGLMVCKAAKQLGLITSYRHAFGLHSALRALVVRPVITGVSWYSSFDTPDKNGLVEIAPGASIRGGHEIVADQIDAENNLVWFWNSWGPSYGVGGKFCMSFDTWGRLLKEQGDVTVPIK